jgi:AcrR family transcriptional regulator
MSRSRHGVRHSDEQLLDGARSIFLRRGYHEASMDEIAAAAEASKPTLYNRIGDKEQIYRLVMRREADDLGEVLATARSIFGNESPRIRVRVAISSFFEWARVEPEGFRMLFSDFVTEVGWQERSVFLDRIRTQVAAGLRANIEPRSGLELGESADVVASMCISLVVGGAHRAFHTAEGTEGAVELIIAFAEEALVNLDWDRLIAADGPAEANA